MKTKFSMMLTLVSILAGSACTVNVNQPNANGNTNLKINSNTVQNSAGSPTAEKVHWSVVVCSSRAKTVTMSAGANENDSDVFATWKQGATQKVYDLPNKLQNLSSIYLMASASDKNQVEMCVLYDGKPKKRVEFDDSEDNTIKSTDADDKDCRCVE